VGGREGGRAGGKEHTQPTSAKQGSEEDRAEEEAANSNSSEPRSSSFVDPCCGFYLNDDGRGA